MDKLGQIRRLRWKERLLISKNAKFESDLLKTKEDTAHPSHEILQMFVWWVGCYTAVFSVVMQRSSPGGALRDDTKNGCVADYMVGGTNLPQWPPQKQLNSIVTV